MQRQRTLAAIVALGILIVSPIAWGCEGADMKSCSMSDCPMSDMQEVDGCHEPTASSTQSFSCESGHQVLIACCDAPVDQEQAQVAAATFLKHGSTPLLLLPETSSCTLHPDHQIRSLRRSLPSNTSWAGLLSSLRSSSDSPLERAVKTRHRRGGESSNTDLFGGALCIGISELA